MTSHDFVKSSRWSSFLSYVEKGVHNLVVLFMDKDYYNQRYCAKFPTPTKLDVYDETIPKNATSVVWSKAEAVHTAKIVDYLIFDASERETHEFILAVIEDTWIPELCEPITFYTAMTPSEILDHLETLCRGLNDLDVLSLQNEIQ